MNWQEILILQAITTVIAIAKSGDGKGKFRPALLKIFKTIYEQFKAEADFQAVIRSDVGGK